MITLYEYNSLWIEEQQAVLWRDGEFLDNHITKNSNVLAMIKICVVVKRFRDLTEINRVKDY